MIPPGHERYLGDGVYATWDGDQVVLDLRGQDDSRIALEPAVLDRLFRMAADALGTTGHGEEPAGKPGNPRGY